MKWGTIQIMISAFVWSLLIGIIVHHVQTKPEAHGPRRIPRAVAYSRPSMKGYPRRRMQHAVVRAPQKRVVDCPVRQEVPAFQEVPASSQAPSIDLAEVAEWPAWLQEKYKDQIEAKKAEVEASRPKVTVIKQAPGKYDQLSNLLWGAIDERMKKKEDPKMQPGFRAGRGKHREITGGVVEDVANVLVDYKKKKSVPKVAHAAKKQKSCPPAKNSIRANREFVEELSQFIMKYNNAKQAQLRVEE